MKKLFRKIQMWWWKKHNPKKYVAEYWRDAGERLSEIANRATASLTKLASVLQAYEAYKDQLTKEGQKPNGNQKNS